MEWNLLKAYKFPAKASAEILKRVGALVGTLLFKVSDVAHLVIDYDTIVSEGKVEAYTVDLTGTLGTFVSFRTIPSNEEWTDCTYMKGASTGNSYFEIQLPDGNFYMYEEGTATATRHYTSGRVKFPPGTKFGILATGNAGDGSRLAMIMYNRRTLQLP